MKWALVKLSETNLEVGGLKEAWLQLGVTCAKTAVLRDGSVLLSDSLAASGYNRKLRRGASSCKWTSRDLWTKTCWLPKSKIFQSWTCGHFPLTYFSVLKLLCPDFLQKTRPNALVTGQSSTLPPLTKTFFEISLSVILN